MSGGNADVHPRSIAKPWGYGTAKSVATACGVATVWAAALLPDDHAETKADAAPSALGCGDDGGATVVGVSGGAVVVGGVVVACGAVVVAAAPLGVDVDPHAVATAANAVTLTKAAHRPRSKDIEPFWQRPTGIRGRGQPLLHVDLPLSCVHGHTDEPAGDERKRAVEQPGFVQLAERVGELAAVEVGDGLE
jgi:hypothetical protein